MAKAAIAKPEFYIEEFLYRGRRKDDERPTGWHIILGVEGADLLGRPYLPMQIMSSEQAVKAGWDIPDIMAEINAEVMAELETERQKSKDAVQALDEALSAAEASKATAEATAEKNVLLVADLSAARAKIAEMNDYLAAV